MSKEDFSVRKQRLLKGLVLTEESEDRDRSPKGFVDWPVVPLLSVLNRHESFVSTSSCSGRICVYGGRKGYSGEWLLCSHSTVTKEQIVDSAISRDRSKDGKVSILFEPMVLHIECDSIESACELINICRQNGFKESGISIGSGSHRIMARISFNGRMEVPLPSVHPYLTQRDDSCQPVWNSFLDYCVSEMNQRLKDNWKRIDHLTMCIERELISVGNSEISRQWWFDAYQNLCGPMSQATLSAVDSKLDSVLESLKQMRHELFESDLCSLIDSPNFPSLIQLNKWQEKVAQKMTELCEGSLFTERWWAEKMSRMRKYEKLGDCVLFADATELKIISSELKNYNADYCDGFWSSLCCALKCDRIGEQQRIDSSVMRQSQVSSVLMYDPNQKGTMVKHRENGIWYQFDLSKCMFSSGNLTEKQRIVREGPLKLKSKRVLDLYAGIGYFTLSYLVHGSVSYLYACEINPNAMLALEENLKLNKIKDDRFTLLFGDNRETTKDICVDCVDIVNLGLLPSSKDGYLPALRAIDPLRGGLLHIHENVNKDEVERKRDEIINELNRLCAVHSDLKLKSEMLDHWECTEMFRVKWYAPNVAHMVYDVCWLPSQSIGDSQ